MPAPIPGRLALACALAALPALAEAQPRRKVTRTTTTTTAAPAPERGAFVVTLGSDTVAAERYTRTAGRIEGDVFQRAPMPRVTHYAVTLDAGAARPAPRCARAAPTGRRCRTHPSAP